MSDDLKQTVPGLAVWVMLFITALGITAFTVQLPSKYELEQNSIRAWIAGQSKPYGDTSVVLVLGTSLTGCALDSAALLEQTISTLSGKPVKVLKVWKLNAGPSDFADLSPAILSTRPAVVIVEANILFYSFSKKKGWTEYVQRFRDFIHRKKYAYQPDSKPLVLKRNISELEMFRSGLTDSSQLTAFSSTLSRWQSLGARLSLLNFPLEAPLETRKWNSPDTSNFFENVRRLNRHCTIPFVNRSPLLGQQFFIDHAHMNALGQERQSRLFCTLVAEQLGKP